MLDLQISNPLKSWFVTLNLFVAAVLGASFVPDITAEKNLFHKKNAGNSQSVDAVKVSTVITV